MTTDHKSADDDEEMCLAKDACGYECTRPKGHDGEHCAHITTNRIVRRWPR